jgi:hypothetical protein
VVTIHYLDDFEQSQTITQTLTVDVETPPEEVPAEESAEEGEAGFWGRILRVLRGLLGLGS